LPSLDYAAAYLFNRVELLYIFLGVKPKDKEQHTINKLPHIPHSLYWIDLRAHDVASPVTNFEEANLRELKSLPEISTCAQRTKILSDFVSLDRIELCE
jgi:hypothetical protein